MLIDANQFECAFNPVCSVNGLKERKRGKKRERGKDREENGKQGRGVKREREEGNRGREME